MLKSKTLFVVGAGASKEVGLPVGSELKSIIGSKLNIRFEDGHRLASGDRTIWDALEIYSRKVDSSGGSANKYRGAAITLSDALEFGSSIDAVLDTHWENARAQLCGKLGIIASILEAEKKSQLALTSDRVLKSSSITNTWYSRFFERLVDGVPRSDPGRIFQNVSFITFNYDRCIEHFLFQAVKQYFNFTDGEARSAMEPLKVLHPYGIVGSLPWQSLADGLEFGSDFDARRLLTIVNKIQTFTEQMSDQEAVGEIRKQVCEADKIVFLGFSFHPQNMKLLDPGEECVARYIYATVYGLSESDSALIAQDILGILKRPQHQFSLESPRNVTCAGLIANYARSIAE